jgi:fumarate reductase subunit D
MQVAFALLTAVCVALVAAAVTLFHSAFDQPVAAWFCLGLAAIIAITMIAAVVSTALADRTGPSNADDGSASTAAH